MRNKDSINNFKKYVEKYINKHWDDIINNSKNVVTHVWSNKNKIKVYNRNKDNTYCRYVYRYKKNYDYKFYHKFFNKQIKINNNTEIINIWYNFLKNKLQNNNINNIKIKCFVIENYDLNNQSECNRIKVYSDNECINPNKHIENKKNLIAIGIQILKT